MNNHKLCFLLMALLTGFSLAACGADEYGPDEKNVQLTLPTAVTDYVLDTTDYSTQPNELTDTIRVLYRRNDNNDSYSNYAGWRIWAWDKGGGGNGWWYEFTKYNEYGIICDIPMSEFAANGTSTDEIGVVITTCASTTSNWEGSYSKDPDCDLVGEVSAYNLGGIQMLYAKSKIERFFYSLQSVFMSTLSSARYVDEKTIQVFINASHKDFKAYAKRFTILINNEPYTSFSIQNEKTITSGSSYSVQLQLALKNAMSINDSIVIKYTFSSDFTDFKDMLLTTYYDSDQFISDYSYSGDDLGVTFSGGTKTMPTATVFKVWAPTSSRMILNIYNSGDYVNDLIAANTYEMTLGEKGVWSYVFNSDLSNKYYTLTCTNSNGVNEIVDPYAKSCGLNGRRGMIVNFDALNEDIEGWSTDVRPDYGTNGTDASIYEIHVRDMTINPNSGVKAENRGKFLGLAQTGTTYTQGTTTVSTGLDHMKELGITHVQIQPLYDFSSVDESTLDTSMGEDNYNWGYDPLNYNCLEGSYSTDPTDGSVRIKEAKQMIMAMHQAGININMDVVYNHTSSFSDSNFEKLVPYYYHRTKASGTAYNGSGCGNEMASDRYMVNKFVRESCAFWTEEYHLSGFRFDLMGLMDNQVMIDIYNDCSSIYDKIMIYGEPWTGGTTKLVKENSETNLSSQETVQSSLAQSYFAGNGVYVGAFNDVIRNAVRGDNNPGLGWVSGMVTNTSTIVPGIKGAFNSGQLTIEPQQVLNYISCHDNYTLYDQLVQKLPASRVLSRAYTQAETVVFTAQGVPFMQEGEDFMRTKAYEKDGKTIYSGNSYNVGDLINNMDYSLKVTNIGTFNYFKTLIDVRKTNNQLTLSTREDVTSALGEVVANNSTGLLSYKYSTDDGEIYVVNACNSGTISLGSSYEVLLSNDSSVTIGGTYSSLSLSSNTSVILRKK